MRACVRACVCVCARTCVCVRACVRVCVCVVKAYGENARCHVCTNVPAAMQNRVTETMFVAPPLGTSTETTRLIREGEKGRRGWGERGGVEEEGNVSRCRRLNTQL